MLTESLFLGLVAQARNVRRPPVLNAAELERVVLARVLARPDVQALLAGGPPPPQPRSEEEFLRQDAARNGPFRQRVMEQFLAEGRSGQRRGR